MKDAKEYVRKLNIVSIKEKEKEEQPEEKEEDFEKVILISYNLIGWENWFMRGYPKIFEICIWYTKWT